MSPSTVIMICAPQRSGTSCVAGILNALGIPMGFSWRGADNGNPTGYFEDTLLRDIAQASVPETLEDTRLNTFEDRVQLFRQWVEIRSADGPVIGGKYPALCTCVAEIVAAIPDVRFIVPERSSQDCANSMHARRWAHLSWFEKRVRFQMAINQRDADIKASGAPVLRFPFAGMIQQPDVIVRQIAAFCEVPLTAAAISFIKPQLNHHTRLAS